MCGASAESLHGEIDRYWYRTLALMHYCCRCCYFGTAYVLARVEPSVHGTEISVLVPRLIWHKIHTKTLGMKVKKTFER